MSPTVGSIWARATRKVSLPGALAKYRRPGRRSGPRATSRVLSMRARRHFIGVSLASLLLIAAAPSLAAAAQKPFIAPLARPTDPRPTDSPDPNRNTYTVPEAPRSPVCTANFCVHWVAVGTDAPNLDRRQRQRHPRLRRTGGEGRRTRLLGRERPAGLARPEVRRAGRGEATARPTSTCRSSAGRCSATRRPTAARRPRDTGFRAACTATWSSTTTTPRPSSRAPRSSTTSR